MFVTSLQIEFSHNEMFDHVGRTHTERSVEFQDYLVIVVRSYMR